MPKDSQLMILILLLLILSILLCGAFFCGYVIGSSQGKQIKHQSKEHIIYLSPKGECYHTMSDCKGLAVSRSSSLSSKRACSFCAK